MVDVVQLVEHRIVVPSVVGSSPIIHPESRLQGLLFSYCYGGIAFSISILYFCGNHINACI